MSEHNRFSALIKTRATTTLREAVEKAAQRDLTSTSAYARKALANQLRKDGIGLTDSSDAIPSGVAFSGRDVAVWGD